MRVESGHDPIATHDVDILTPEYDPGLLVGLVILSPCIWLVNRPRPYLLAFIFALIVSGVYSIEQSFFQVGIVFATGLLVNLTVTVVQVVSVAAGNGLMNRVVVVDSLQLNAISAACVDRGTSSYLGSEVNLGFQWRFVPNVALDVVGSYMWAGNALSAHAATNVTTGIASNARNPNDVQSVVARIRYSW